jgi:serine/threonine-protein kinase
MDQHPIGELFTRFLEREAEQPGSDFEAWLAELPGDAPREKLRRRHASWRATRAELRGEPELGREAPDALELGYEKLELLGRGGFGSVWRARDKALQREVAIKVVTRADAGADERRRFVAEARLLARIDHPNVVAISAIDEHDGEIRLVLEHVRGRTLEAIVRDDGPLSAHETALVGIELCRALAAVHAQGLVHLDVKPGNVMRAEGGRIVLLDFGFARERVAEALLDEGPRGGSPPFMAPEHLLGAGELGPRTDVYSLGATLFRCASGHHPYRFESQAELFECILEGRRTPLLDLVPTAPSEFAALLERAMAHDPAERFESAGAFEAALRAFAAGAAGRESVAQAPRARLALGAGVLAAALGGGLWWGTRPAAPDVHIELREVFESGESRVLAGDAALELGARVHLLVRSDEPFHLYVFNADEVGNSFQLAPSSDAPALLDGGVEHRLPQATGGAGNWVLDRPGGVEHIFVFAARTRIELLDAVLADVAAPGEAKPSFDLAFGPPPPSIRARGFGSIEDARAELGAGLVNGSGGLDLRAFFTGIENVLGRDGEVLVARYTLAGPAPR